MIESISTDNQIVISRVTTDSLYLLVIQKDFFYVMILVTILIKYIRIKYI